ALAAAASALALTEPFALESPEDAGPFAALVVGSDEVWNLPHPWYGGVPGFFGEGWRTDRLVAHAASFGSYYSDAPLEQCWRECLRRFGAISVRDHHS